MKKKALIGISGLFVIVLCIGLYLWFNKDNTQVYENNKEEVKMQISGFNGIAMMYETGPGTGEYSESKSSLWPESGYIFNENLSTCENGGKLSWNDELGAVTLHSNKSDSCYVYFDMYIIPIINSVTTSNIETDSITLIVNVTNGNNQVTTYYYSKDNGNSYETSTSNTYTFSGLDMGTEYNFSVYVEDSEGYASEAYALSETTDDIPPTFADTCRETGSNTLACYVASQYTNDGENGIYYHDADLANGAKDNSYRYAGANPNNYVCFGSDAAICPEDNLYRIIGVFGGEVKLIRNYSIGNEPWSGSIYNQNNSWYSSTLNTSTLNNTFLNNFEQIWIDKISTHSWQIGGLTGSNGYSNGAQTAYNYEVGSNNAGSTDSMKIGLMYLSDYYYAADTSYWLTDGMSYNDACNYNWLCLKSSEWVISKRSDNSNSAFTISYTGFVGDYFVNATYAIRPTFYLNSNVSYASGTGTQTDPIRLVI